MIHTGSRGLGYQICDDYLALMVKHANETGIALPDRQLACAYLNSGRKIIWRPWPATLRLGQPANPDCINARSV